MLRVRRTAAVAAVAALTSASLIAGCAPRTGAASSNDGPARFQHQKVVWHGCQNGPKDTMGGELDKAGAQCGEVTVPLDYRHPEGRTITVAMSRLGATDPARRHGTLLYNPGGPGVPAMYLALQLRQAEPVVAARYDVIGMDPRFVGRSTLLNCHWPAVSIGSAGPDRSTFEKTVRLSRDLASRCARHRSVLPFVSTRNTARDMDVIRAALGEKKLNYIGSSYGTYLGEVYLQLFPHRADRVVLDSALDPDLYGPDLTRTSGSAVGRALEHWATWVARRDSRYHLGSTTAEVLSAINDLNRTVSDGLIRVGGQTVDAQVLPQLLWNVTAGDDDEAYASYSADVKVLTTAARGIKVTPTQRLEQILTGLAAPDPEGTFSVQTASQCADRAASRDPEAYYRDIQAHRTTEPVFGPLTRTVTPCSFWPAAPAEPATKVRNNVPVLMVGATGDPAAVYQGQLAAHRDLRGSRLITLRGAFHHTVYAGLFAPKNTCIDNAVNKYLEDGILPPSDTSCRR